MNGSSEASEPSEESGRRPETSDSAPLGARPAGERVIDDDVYREAVAVPAVEIGSLAEAVRNATATAQDMPATSVELPENPSEAKSTAARYSGRIGGLDIARALAIFGMFYAHVGPEVERSGIGSFLDSLPEGRSSILFAVLAGVSLSILTGRNVPYRGERMRSARLRIFGRSATLLAIAGPLSVLGVPVAIILGCYAAWFIASLPMTRWGARRLFSIAGGLALAGPVVLNVSLWLMENFHLWPSDDANGFTVDVFLTGMYPGVVYMAYVVAGMAIGRLDLASKAVQGRLVVIGSCLMLLGYGSAWIVGRVFSQSLALAPSQGDFDPDLEGIQPWLGLPFPSLHSWVGAGAHTHTIFEAVGSGGFCIAFLGICLLIGRLSLNVLYPLAAVGTMSLTAYSAHVVVIAFNLDWNYTRSWFPILALVIGSLVLCTAWKSVSARGPLEWLMWKVSLLVARVPE